MTTAALHLSGYQEHLKTASMSVEFTKAGPPPLRSTMPSASFGREFCMPAISFLLVPPCRAFLLILHAQTHQGCEPCFKPVVC